MPMQSSDLEKFSQVFFVMGRHYGKPLDQELVNFYFQALAPKLTIDQIEQAAMRHVTTSEFFPKISDFLNGIQGSIEGRALAAWADFEDVVSGGGRRAVTDPATAYAVRVTFGSVGEACRVLPARGEPMFIAFEKRFVANYQHAVETGKDEVPLIEGGNVRQIRGAR